MNKKRVIGKVTKGILSALLVTSSLIGAPKTEVNALEKTVVRPYQYNNDNSGIMLGESLERLIPDPIYDSSYTWNGKLLYWGANGLKWRLLSTNETKYTNGNQSLLLLLNKPIIRNARIPTYKAILKEEHLKHLSELEQLATLSSSSDDVTEYVNSDKTISFKNDPFTDVKWGVPTADIMTNYGFNSDIFAFNPARSGWVGPHDSTNIGYYLINANYPEGAIYLDTFDGYANKSIKPDFNFAIAPFTSIDLDSITFVMDENVKKQLGSSSPILKSNPNGWTNTYIVLKDQEQRLENIKVNEVNNDGYVDVSFDKYGDGNIIGAAITDSSGKDILNIGKVADIGTGEQLNQTVSISLPDDYQKFGYRLKIFSYNKGTTIGTETSSEVYEIYGDVEVNSTTFPDENLRNRILENVANENGMLTENIIKSTTELDLSNLGIENLGGIQYFTSLKILNVNNNKLSQSANIDLTRNIQLEDFYCQNNQLAVLKGDRLPLNKVNSSIKVKVHGEGQVINITSETDQYKLRDYDGLFPTTENQEKLGFVDNFDSQDSLASIVNCDTLTSLIIDYPVSYDFIIKAEITGSNYYEERGKLGVTVNPNVPERRDYTMRFALQDYGHMWDNFQLQNLSWDSKITFEGFLNAKADQPYTYSFYKMDKYTGEYIPITSGELTYGDLANNRASNHGYVFFTQEPFKYKVKINPDNGTEPKIHEDLYWNSKFPNPYFNQGINVTKKGYQYTGWSYVKDGVKTLLPYNVNSTKELIYSNFADNVQQGMVEMKAEYTAKKYRVSYNPDVKGMSIPDKENVLWTDSNLLPDIAPERTDGYALVGWVYVNPKTYQETNIKVTNETVLSDLHDAYEDESSFTLKAKWTNADFTVSFDPDNGESAIEKTVKYDTSNLLPDEPTKTGYKFVGWKVEGKPDIVVDATTKYSDMAQDSSVTTVVVKAVWEKENYIGAKRFPINA